MLGNILPPYHSLQELNLDWILTKVKDMLRFLPDDGSVGQILRRTAHGAEWSNEQGGGGAVSSVNGQTGDVVLNASDVGALPDSYSAPVDSVNGQTGTVVLTKSDVGLGSVDNVQQYSASNPPPYPVTSVNGQTGAISLQIPSFTILEKTYTNITLNANKEANLGSNIELWPSGATLINMYILSASTASGALRIEPSNASGGNIWLIGNTANQSIASVKIRSVIVL